MRSRWVGKRWVGHRWTWGLTAATLTLASGTALSQAPAEPIALPPILVVAPSPLATVNGVARDRLPFLSRGFEANQLDRNTGRADLPGTLERELGAVSANEAQSNPFQPDFQFRGFTASPLLGTPQGLAVYQDGVRINEAFGDLLHWDLIPENAIRRVDLLGSNPIFGLNAIGGAISLQMKDGFTAPGVRLQALGGSFGRVGLGGEYGVQVGNVAGYIAAEGINEDGWRRESPSRLRRLYADLGFRGREAELHLSLTSGRSRLVGNGTIPVELRAQDRRAVFTFPDRTVNDLTMLSARANWTISDALSAQAVAYVRRFRQQTFNGDIAKIEGCDEGVGLDGLLCAESGDPILSSRSGQPFSTGLLGDAPAGALNRTNTRTTGAGGAAQLSSTAPLFGRGNTLAVGVAFDRAETTFAAGSELGSLTPERGVLGRGEEIALADGSITPVRLKTDNTYWGLYATNTLELTDRLALTAGARFNIADVNLRDQLGTDLNGSHEFNRINLSGGATYRLLDGLNLYAGYAEANRAPTAAELSCADETRPCALGAFFLADPPLKQVVSRTFEAGLRGAFPAPWRLGQLRWNAGLFHADLSNDIINVASEIQGRGFFRNAGTTRRQGAEVGGVLTSPDYRIALDYAYVDATFESDLRLGSPNSPDADEDGTIAVRKGSQIPGIPNHRLRFNADVRLTDRWSVGGTVSYTSGQFLRGDESNVLPKLGGYTLIGLRSTVRLYPGVEAFALLTNLLDQRFATFGQLYGLETAQEARLPLNDPRSVSPGAPRAVYGGLRVRF